MTRLKIISIVCFSSIYITGCSLLPNNTSRQVEVKPASSLAKIDSDHAATKAETIAVTTKAASPLLTDPLLGNDLWAQIRNQYGLPLIANQEVEKQKKYYAKHPKLVSKVIKRAQPYLFYISEEIKRRGMPMELVFLPFVESAYDPFAYSHVRASGLWQFTPLTAGDFNLNQTWWFDGRRDIQASTNAALDYLQQLQRRFDGDWLLALAAYNSGGGTVSKAIRNNKRQSKAVDFWSLKLPRETRHYVPKLLALSQIFQSPKQYKIDIPKISAKPHFQRFDLDFQLDLAQASRMASTSLDDMYLLNPGYSQWATAPEGPQHLLVPVEKAEAFSKNLAQLPVDKRIHWKRYKIKAGDSLSQIAQKHKVKASALRQANKLTGNQIRAGRHLMIPVSSLALSDYRNSDQQRNTRRTYQSKLRYKVRRGDSFWSIATKYRVNTDDLLRWNKLKRSSVLQPGQRITVYRGKQYRKAFEYKVKSGDSLARIAKHFGTSINEIIKLNRIKRNKLIKPGQSLLVRRG